MTEAWELTDQEYEEALEKACREMRKTGLITRFEQERIIAWAAQHKLAQWLYEKRWMLPQSPLRKDLMEFYDFCKKQEVAP